MKKFFAAFAITIALTSSAFAHSYHRYYHHHHNPMVQGIGHGLVHMLRSMGHSNLSAACRQAASMGGPCGCWAEEHFFGRSDHVLNGHNLWLANEWAHVFPHVAPGPGTAAVWYGRHVAPVISEVHNGMVTVEDSWATHDVSIRGLIFVNPNGGINLAKADFQPKHYHSKRVATAAYSNRQSHKEIQSFYQYNTGNLNLSEIH